MARSENFLLRQMSGHIGKQLVIKQYGDRTVISKFPNMTRRKLSSKQKRVNKTMEDANEYAQNIIADPRQSAQAQVRLNITRNKLYTTLIKEYFKEVYKPLK